MSQKPIPVRLVSDNAIQLSPIYNEGDPVEAPLSTSSKVAASQKTQQQKNLQMTKTPITFHNSNTQGSPVNYMGKSEDNQLKVQIKGEIPSPNRIGTEYGSHEQMNHTERGTSVLQSKFVTNESDENYIGIEVNTQSQIRMVNIQQNNTDSTYTEKNGVSLSKYMEENSNTEQSSGTNQQVNIQQNNQPYNNNLRENYPLIRKGNQVYAQTLQGDPIQTQGNDQDSYLGTSQHNEHLVTPAFGGIDQNPPHSSVLYHSQGTKFQLDNSARVTVNSSTQLNHNKPAYKNGNEVDNYNSQTSSQFNEYVQKLKQQQNQPIIVEQQRKQQRRAAQKLPRTVLRYQSVGHNQNQINSRDSGVIGSFYSGDDFNPPEDVFESRVGMKIRKNVMKHHESGSVDKRLSNAIKREREKEMTVSYAGKFLRQSTHGQELMIQERIKYGFERKGDFIKMNQAQVKQGVLPQRNQRQLHMLKKLEIERHYIGALLSAQSGMSQVPPPVDEYTSQSPNLELPQRGSLPSMSHPNSSQIISQCDTPQGNDNLRRLGPKNSLAMQMYLCHYSVNKEAQRNASQASLVPLNPESNILEPDPSHQRLLLNRSALDNSMLKNRTRKEPVLDNYYSQTRDSTANLQSNQSIQLLKRSSVPNLIKGGASLRSICDYNENELDERGNIDRDTYMDYKRRTEERLQEGKYKSESEGSISEEEEFQTSDQKENKQFRKYGGIDYQQDVDRHEYQKLKALIKSGDVNIKSIIMKNPKYRSNEEIDYLATIIKFTVTFFKKFDKQLLVQLCEKLEGKSFKKHQYLMREGTFGDCMFIIIDGDCGVYKNEPDGKRCKAAITVLRKGSVCGETSLKTTDSYEMEDNRRNASIISHTDKTIVLELKKFDYHEIVHQYRVVDLLERQKYLKNKIPFFKGFTRANETKLVDFNQALDVQVLKQGEIIYDIGSPAESFYILKKGKCLVETIIEIESFYRFPIDKKKWELRKVTRKIQYKIHEVSKGGFFGHEEILQGYRRRSRVKALTNAQVYYINSDEMLKHLPQERQDHLRSTMRSFDLEEMVAGINSQFEKKKYMNKAMLDGTKMNGVNFSGDRLGYNGDLLPIKKMQKLSKWIDKARYNKTNNKDLIHQLKKIVVLDKTEEPIQIELNDANVDIIQQKRARFVLPEETKKSLEFQNSIIDTASAATVSQFPSPQLSPEQKNENMIRTGLNISKFGDSADRLELNIQTDLDSI